MDKQRPYPVTLLGQAYVVWWDSAASQWRVAQDRCPHRLAPLSEGRVEADGTLACSYHGWRFDGSGRCSTIPQIGDPKAHAAALASPRSCLRVFPTQVKSSLLFVWLESGPEAEAEAAAKQIPMPSVIEESPSPFTVTEVPIDLPMWLEQGFDPSHAPFLHHGIAGMKMGDNEPMDAEVLPLSRVDAASGFTWRHGAYMRKYHGMKGVRVFEPPCLFHTDYDKGPVGLAAIYATPVRPGVTRVIAKFTFKSAPSGLFKLLMNLPHWLLFSTKLQDQDTIINARQEALMRARGETWRDYYSPARADVGAVAARAWFDRAGYDSMWERRLGKGAAAAAVAALAAAGEPPLEKLLDQWERHTKHCAVCQKGMRTTEQWAQWARAAAVGLGVLAACLAAAARALTPAAAAAAVAAVAAARLAEAVLRARHDRFVNSADAWRRGGGLSLAVPGAKGPISLGN